MCEYCDMREVRSGNVVFVEGAPFEDPPYHSAYIEQESDGFWLHCETHGWIEGETEHTSVPISHCPWCGRELKARES